MATWRPATPGRGRRGRWSSPPAIATRPSSPRSPAQGASRLHQLVPGAYRNPAHLPPGGVLIVGASASGLQLADELVRAGRRVILSAGQHTRVPRLYRGADLFSWLDRLDILRDAADAVYDVETSRAQPSFQLVGRPSHDTLDLRGLAARGVAVVGRLTGLEGERASFADDLIASTVAADLKLAMLLRRIDRAAPPGTDRRAAVPAALAGVLRRHRPHRRPAPGRHRHRDLGDRVPPSLRLARCPGHRRAAARSSTSAASRRRRACSCSACSSCGIAARASSTASVSTPRSSPAQIARNLGHQGAAA